MATIYDSKFAAAALSILGKFGVPATITVRSTGGFDPLTGDVTNTETVTALDKVSPPINYQPNEVDGSNIINDDFKVYVAGSDVSTITKGSEMLINGVTVMIVKANPVYSGALVALWVCQCRHGNEGG